MSETNQYVSETLSVAQQSRAIVNLRGAPGNPAFVSAVKSALGLDLPVRAGTFVSSGPNRLIWIGPDEWLSVGPDGTQAPTLLALRDALADIYSAVTDVSSAFLQMRVTGVDAREMLAQGCPLDLHPRKFKVGMAAGSLFFKAQVCLVMVDEQPTYDLLVRRSFTGYFWQLVQAVSRQPNG